MKDSVSVRQSYCYVLTIEGRKALDDPESCQCRPRIAGLLVECPDCGTVYGHLKDMGNWGNGRAEWKR